jgi:hypothetical protein
MPTQFGNLLVEPNAGEQRGDLCTQASNRDVLLINGIS